MNVRQIELVRSTFSAMAPHAAQFGRVFYEHLFALDPAVRKLFSANIAAQADKLVAMLSSIVADLDDTVRLQMVFAALGRRHADYGVAEAHYDSVGAALLITLRNQLGPAFSTEVEEAWATIYGELAEAMICAGRSCSRRDVSEVS